jgi:hypothetical protein
MGHISISAMLVMLIYLGKDVNTIKRNTEALADISKVADLKAM